MLRAGEFMAKDAYWGSRGRQSFLAIGRQKRGPCIREE